MGGCRGSVSTGRRAGKVGEVGEVSTVWGVRRKMDKQMISQVGALVPSSGASSPIALLGQAYDNRCFPGSLAILVVRTVWLADEI